jgi:hypothetical protein
MIVKANKNNIRYGDLIFIVICYVAWVLLCSFVVYLISEKEIIYFGYIWMVFGLVGLVLVPLKILEIFTKYQFVENDKHYVVFIKSIWKSRKYEIDKNQFIGFEYQFDSDDQKKILK